jgi:hypothetical protein
VGRFRVIITKASQFQGRLEQWSNVYILDTGTFETFEDEAAINSIVALEKTVHGGNVQFVKGETYGINPVTGDNPRFGKPLSGNGTMGSGPQIYKETAVLVKFELPRAGGLTGIGRRRMLRKWLHCGYLPTAASTGMAYGDEPLGSTTKTAFLNNYANPLRNGNHGNGQLSAPNGDKPTAAAVHDYLEHRQFHAGRKKKKGILT